MASRTKSPATSESDTTTTTTTTTLADVSAAVHGASTVEEHRAAIVTASSFVLATEADAFDSLLAGRRFIGESLYLAQVARIRETDAKAEVPAAATVKFPTVMMTMTAKDQAGYGKLAPAKRLAGRAWSTLAEDYSLFVHTSGDEHLPAYRAYLARTGKGVSMRGYLDYVRTTVKVGKAAAEAGAKAGNAAKGAAAKAKAVADYEAAAKVAADTAKEERETKARNVATGILRQVAEHPTANVVPGATYSGDDAMRDDPAAMRALASALLVIAADREAKAKAAKDGKGQAPALTLVPTTETETAALAVTAEEAAEAPAPPTASELLALLRAGVTLDQALDMVGATA